ncbi:MAG TPA: DUF1559 domain-containing protein, partial [Armatimonadota bacterium]|nr:DUF1559 domain-containing protein [Armatimonadota bacterium]
AARQCAVLTACVLAVAWLGWWPVSPLWSVGRADARAQSCRANLKSLCLGLQMYAEDYDGRLPMCSTSNDLVGVDYERLAYDLAQPCPNAKAVLGGGAIFPYVKNTGVFFCPSDPWNLDWRGRPIADRYPEPGISYTWNAAVAGQLIADLPDDTWVLRDREPWHRGGRNVGYVNGRAAWVRE